MRFLYRYYSNREHILDTITNLHLYHCQPNLEFNDPFDCRPYISIKQSIGFSDDIWLQFFAFLHRGQYPDEAETEILKRAQASLALGLHKNARLRQQIDQELRDVGALVRVCCFAKSPRNAMMWAHYANKYQGVVLQFRTSHLRDMTSKEFRGLSVQYSPRPLSVQEFVDAHSKAIDSHDIRAMASLFWGTKTTHWSGEEEVRFYSDQSKTHIEFDEAAMPGVIFGHKCDRALVHDIRAALSKWQWPPILFQTSIRNTHHKLYIAEIERPA